MKRASFENSQGEHNEMRDNSKKKNTREKHIKQMKDFEYIQKIQKMEKQINTTIRINTKLREHTTNSIRRYLQ